MYPLVANQLLQAARLRQARYLAYEMLRTLCPKHLARFHARFEGLLAYVSDGGHILSQHSGEPDNDYLKIHLTFPEHASTRFASVVLDALFLEFMKLQDFHNPIEALPRFCENELARFVKKYFPDLDLRTSGFKHLQRLCLELKAEAASMDAATSMEKAGNILSEGRMSPVGESRNHAWLDLMSALSRAAWSKAPILLTGETGTGKEMAARFVHSASPRAGGPFVAINCAAIPDNLIESELFGYRQGAFSEARKDKPGLIVQAHGGSLFLDEIAELNHSLQAKLLRFLQDHAFTPLGGISPVKIDVRVISATNQDLDLARTEKRFREDLYYRLNVFQFHLPPLRDRKEDLPDLAERFVSRFNMENNIAVKGLSKGALKILTQYSWPGNVRELENVVQRAVILARQGMIKPQHLPPAIRAGTDAPTVPRDPAIDEDRLGKAVEAALHPETGTGKGEPGLGRTVPLTRVLRFFSLKMDRPFPPRDFSEFITPPGQSRRDKLAGRILQALAASGVLERNAMSAQASRYVLRPAFMRTAHE